MQKNKFGFVGMKMKVKLGEVAVLINGDRGKNYPSQVDILEEGEMLFVNAGHLSNGTINFDGMNYISKEKYNSLNSGKFYKNDILYCLRGSLGKKALVREGIEGAIASSLVIIRPNTEKVDSEYLMFALDSPSIAEQLIKANNGSSQPNLSAASVRQYEFDLPDKKMQEAIVDRLLVVKKIVVSRKQQLQQLDELVKARFVEMFGDPIRNTQNRPTTDFINVVKMQRGFDLPVQDRRQDGDIPVFGSNGALDRHNVAKVQGGGVITGRSGTIGKVYYTEGDYWPLNTSLFSVDTYGNNIIYLAYLLQMYDLSRFTEGTGVPTLNRNKFHNKPIINVPLDEQEQFATFVEQVDKSKFAVQKAIDEAQTLFDSLMQEYFG